MSPTFHLLYDSDCGFCRWAIDKILVWDTRRRLRPVAIQAPEADGLLPGLDSKSRLASWHLVTPDGRVHSGGAAVTPLLRLLPGARPLAALLGAFPETTDRAYRLAARNRNRFGRLAGAHCRVAGDVGGERAVAHRSRRER
jgi:predicted DCC family thiol-disulfide oxidoreductase YuxK